MAPATTANKRVPLPTPEEAPSLIYDSGLGFTSKRSMPRRTMGLRLCTAI